MTKRTLITRSGIITDTNICTMVDEAIFLNRTGQEARPLLKILTEECTRRFGAKNTQRVLGIIARG